MKSTYAILILSLFIVSCKKDQAVNSTQIEIGDSSGMEVTQTNLNITSPSYGVLASEELDLDNDGQADVSLRSLISGSAGLGQFNTYWIEPLHANCNVAGSIANDTLWAKYDTTYLPNQTGGTLCYWHWKRACEQLDASYDQILVDYDVLSTTLLQAGETLLTSDYFANETSSLLSPDDHTTSPYLEETSNDTSYYSVTSTYVEACQPATENVSGYLGIKLNTSTGTKLGWLKLSIANGYSIQVEEIAIQP